jgi:uncharacterized protein (DUF2384 family)
MNEFQDRVYSLARNVWDDDEDTNAFMNQSHPLLDGETPLALAATEEGAERVEHILQNLRWGLPV